jgi:DNA polymerase III delta prime subunit
MNKIHQVMNTTDHPNPTGFQWTDKYEPNSLDDFILTPDLKKRFQKMIDDQKFPNLLLVGEYGTGKTSLAKFLGDISDSGFKLLGAANIITKNDLEKEIDEFAPGSTLFSGRKVLIVDEGDLLKQDFQNILHGSMDRDFHTCVFIITATELDRISDPLKSRLTVLDFSVPEEFEQKMKEKVVSRINSICELENIDFDEAATWKIVDDNFPDIRKTIIEAEMLMG